MVALAAHVRSAAAEAVIALLNGGIATSRGPLRRIVQEYARHAALRVVRRRPRLEATAAAPIAGGVGECHGDWRWQALDDGGREPAHARIHIAVGPGPVVAFGVARWRRKLHGDLLYGGQQHHVVLLVRAKRVGVAYGNMVHLHVVRIVHARHRPHRFRGHDKGKVLRFTFEGQPPFAALGIGVLQRTPRARAAVERHRAVNAQHRGAGERGLLLGLLQAIVKDAAELVFVDDAVGAPQLQRDVEHTLGERGFHVDDSVADLRELRAGPGVAVDEQVRRLGEEPALERVQRRAQRAEAIKDHA
mmetsp:Transcript_13308/g.39583  ORF Transcript_13308/g.39583 Transcript_13308/m.39583 type:complete len:303 (-) Transcript_13308:39-947(-)